MTTQPPLYQPDLAHIHVDGYGFHWEAAAPAILKWFGEAGIRAGTVVDLGCGGGQWLARLADAGHTPVGIDVSPAMIRASRQLVPQAKLLCGTFADTKIPPCDAVTSLGEPLNYLRTRRQFQRTLQNVARALRPGGLFIFDVRIPATKPVAPRITARTGNDWACISRIEEDAAGRLTRHITTFRRHGRDYRRGEETHRLQLYPQATIATWLDALGFHTRTRRNYGEYRLMPRQRIVIARRCG